MMSTQRDNSRTEKNNMTSTAAMTARTTMSLLGPDSVILLSDKVTSCRMITARMKKMTRWTIDDEREERERERERKVNKDGRIRRQDHVVEAGATGGIRKAIQSAVEHLSKYMIIPVGTE